MFANYELYAIIELQITGSPVIWVISYKRVMRVKLIKVLKGES